MEPMSYRDWLRQAGAKPVAWPDPEPRILIRVRCIPGVYAQHEAKIEDGEPLAEITVNASLLSFPTPLQPNGHPTGECRRWITEAVAETVRRDGRRRCILWPDTSVTQIDDGQPHLRQPSNDHGDQHAQAPA